MRALTARGQATRDKLVAGARDVFAERGFAGTRMGDLADAAGVAHGTVYTYFDTKEDVLLAVLDSVRADLHEAMTVPRLRDPILRVEAANRAYLDGYRAHAQLLQVAQEAAAGDSRFADVLLDLRRTHVARVAAAIRKMQSEGLAAPDLDPQTSAAALCGMVEGFASHWLGRGEIHDEAVVTRTLTQLWVRGLGMPARIEAARRTASAAPSGAAQAAARGAAPASRPAVHPRPGPHPPTRPARTAPS
ncbi:MAG: TetR/AcrR family transcriptional regulator [Candidatus Nanopelagicales bacterium]